jgi:hypothetical protein
LARSSRDPDFAHVLHGLLELPLPRACSVRVLGHLRHGLRGVEEHGVRVEEHFPGDHVPVVLPVQDVGRDVVQVQEVVVVAVALRPELGGQGRVHVGEATGDEGAAAAADGVRAGERDHLVGGEALGGEAGLELREVGEGPGELVGLVCEGLAAVEAAPRHADVDPAVAEDAGRVAGGEGDDVGAGDDGRAGGLDRGLGLVDHLEPAQAVLVGRAFPLGVAVPGAGLRQENGSVAPLRNQRHRSITQ